MPVLADREVTGGATKKGFRALDLMATLAVLLQSEEGFLDEILRVLPSSCLASSRTS